MCLPWLFFGGTLMLKKTITDKETIILGMDPGTSVMGYGLISANNNSFKLLQYGVIHLSKYSSHQLKLKKIFETEVIHPCTCFLASDSTGTIH